MVIIIIVGLIIFAFIISIYENRHLRIKIYNKRIPCDNDKELTIIFLSDLHNCSFGKDNIKLINSIIKINPDCILIGGDMFIGIPGADDKNVHKLLEGIRGLCPIYYAMGNHEFRYYLYPDKYPDKYNDFINLLRLNCIILLDNNAAFFDIKGYNIGVYGLSIEKDNYKRFKNVPLQDDFLERILPDKRKGYYNILLAHNPKYFKNYCRWNPNLILSGHYHGGLARIGKVGFVSPDLRIFPNYAYGDIKDGQVTMIVSGGLGSHSMPIRIFNKPEIVCLKLKGKKDEYTC